MRVTNDFSQNTFAIGEQLAEGLRREHYNEVLNSEPWRSSGLLKQIENSFKQCEKRVVNMNRHFVVGTMVMAVAMLAGQAVLAEPAAIPTMTRAMYKTKTVSFNVRNDSKSPLTIQAGDRQITIDPGKIVAVKLEEGTKLVAVTATAKLAQGDLISVVSSAMASATVAIQ